MEQTRKPITYFEDLANEIIYEIFDLLDFCHLYDTFFNLNNRFQNLLTNSTLPIKLNLSLLSRSTFQRYQTQIILPNPHRIQSLHLSNPFMIDLFLSPIANLLKLTRLENLALRNIPDHCLEDILIHLRSLPYLSSLDVDCINLVRSQDTIYCEIFRLPVLKYCKLSLDNHMTSKSLPISTTELSAIEHLVITNDLQVHEINALLFKFYISL